VAVVGSRGTSVQVPIDSPARVRLVLGALLAGQVLFALLVAFLTSRGFAADPTLTSLFRVVLASAGVALWMGARLARRLYARLSDDGRAAPALRWASLVVRGALAEAFGLLGTTFALVTGDPWFFAGPLVTAAVLLWLMPKDEGGPAGPGEGPSSGSHPIEP
jgi:hypothetical protein